MSKALESARHESSGVRMYVLALYYLLSGNFSLVVALFGVVLIVLGATVMPSVHGVFAGMFGIWGVTLIILGLLAYTILWANQMYAKMQARS